MKPAVKILIDEQAPLPVVEPLRRLLRGHTVDHVDAINWKGKKDSKLLPEAALRGYDVLVTADAGQLSDPAELKLIMSGGIHHVLFEQNGKGVSHLTSMMATIIAGMPDALARLEKAPAQLLIKLTLVKPTHALVIDPRKQPYWPRRRPKAITRQIGTS